MQLQNQIKEICPRLGFIQANIRVAKDCPELWASYAPLFEQKKQLQADAIRQFKPIFDAREAYKKAGQDPSRYRLSAEALHRRFIKSQSLYTINNLVDIINLVSLETGFSMGAYDAEKIEGQIVLRVGQDEDYEGLGRGKLNIQNIPCLCDDLGPFGTPTSDSLRTSIQSSTTKLWLFVFDFGSDEAVKDCLTQLEHLLTKYAQANEIHHGFTC